VASRSKPAGWGERARVAQRARALIDPDHSGGAHRARRAGPALAARVRSTFAEAAARRGWHFNPGARGAVAMAITALVAMLVAGWWVLSARPHASAVSAPAIPVTVVSSSASPRSTPSGSRAADVVVDVVGHVQSPGLYRLPTGARVDDAIRAAGGPVPGTDLSGLNLARKVSDGEQIAVGVAGEPAAAGGAESSSAGPIDLNTASLAQLDALPGVGPVLAQHILDWRTAHGKFDTVDQLREVTGIGEAKFADLRPLVTV
jgi:competence protein ComEA